MDRKTIAREFHGINTTIRQEEDKDEKYRQIAATNLNTNFTTQYQQILLSYVDNRSYIMTQMRCIQLFRLV